MPYKRRWIKRDDRMRAYTDFAKVYDTFMDDTPYEEWCAFLTGILKEFGIGKRPSKDENISCLLFAHLMPLVPQAMAWCWSWAAVRVRLRSCWPKRDLT